jgi:hypothetical protein
VSFPHLLTGDYLTSSPDTTPSFGFALLTAFFVVVLLTSIVAYWRRAKLARENPAMRRRIRQLSQAGMWTGGTGVFLAIMRYLQIPYIDAPLLLYILILIMIAVVAYFVYDFSERYPVAVYQLEESRLERRYRRAARPVTEPRRPKPKVRGKGKRR